MKRYEGNPILKPIGTNSWESRLVFNAGAALVNKQVHLIYRAMGNDHISRLGYASSSDGYNFNERSPDPIFIPTNEQEIDGCEDPRLTVLDDKLVLAYTAFGNYVREKVFQVALTSINLTDFLAKNWAWKKSVYSFPGIRNKNAFLMPQKIGGDYILFHRLDPDICIAKSSDIENDWCELRFVMGPRLKMWDSWKVGTTGPPLLLNEGWLMIYHGVDFDKRYCLGVALLDRDDPGEVIYRYTEPILKPEKDYERYGDVPNVVYSCGNVVIDDKMLIYYGGGDSVLGVATFDLAELLPKK
ncbi:glycosidase [Candidatus Bathyarchaeota archaeon]|nr:glycosidase [Candidatus Bathyarchaeota archaeon]